MHKDYHDKITTIEELKNQVKEFCEDRDWDQFHNPKDLAIGVSTEANELLELFRFYSENEIKEMFQNPAKKERVEEELSDVIFFCLRFAQMNNIDISSALISKNEKTAKKYPIEKSKGSHKKYTEI